MTRIRSAELTYRDGMQFAARTGTGRELTFGKTPDEGYSPVESVVAALAGCSAMDVISIALKKRQKIARYTIRVTAEQRDEYPQVLTRVDLVHEIEGEPGAVQTRAIRRCIELSAGKYCPVSAMLSAGETEIHHAYRIVRPGGEVEEAEVIVTGPNRRPVVVD